MSVLKYAASAFMACATLCAAAPAWSQGYPVKPVRVINAFAPGGPNDLIARPILEGLSRNLGQQFILENKPGANGNIGSLEVVRAAPDGYTLLFVTFSQVTINPVLYKMDFDTVKDLAPITLVTQAASTVITRATLPVNNMKEFIAYARANPGKMTFSSSGNGSQPQLAGELLAMLIKVPMTHVPYKGGGPAFTAVVAGEVDFVVQSPGVAMSNIKAGKVKVMTVSGPKRLAVLPDVPTSAEVGLPEFQSRASTGFMAPAKTPRPIIDKLNTEIIRYLNTPEAKKYFADASYDLIPSTPEEFSRYQAEELARWSAVAKAAKVQVE
jgi:tripartite-type tricarboxylate transporter receptor subunit TctC